MKWWLSRHRIMWVSLWLQRSWCPYTKRPSQACLASQYLEGGGKRMGVQGHLQLYSKFEASLGSLRPCHKQNKTEADNADRQRGMTKERGLRETNPASTLALGNSPCVYLAMVTKHTSPSHDPPSSLRPSPQPATRFIIKQPSTSDLNPSQKAPELWGRSDSHQEMVQGERNFTS